MNQAPPPRQLDIFADSAAVARRNDALAALEKRDAPSARTACLALADVDPEDPHLASLHALTEALATASDAPITDPDALARERAALAGATSVAAHRAFGATAGRQWLRPAWGALAARAHGLAFHPSRVDDHAAPLWLLAEDWRRAAEAVERVVSWRRIPTPLGWMVEARARADGLDSAWPLLCELAWLAPRRLDRVLGRLDDPLLVRLQKKFEAAFEGAGDASDLAWFPAWLLTCTPALAARLAPALPGNHTPPEQAMRLMLDLLALERQGRHHDLVPRRQTLRGLHESLYAIYLSTR